MKNEVSPKAVGVVIVAVVLALGFLGFRWMKSNDTTNPNPEMQAISQETSAQLKARPQDREKIIAEAQRKMMAAAMKMREERSKP
jgi:uncharacterized protein HemX